MTKVKNPKRTIEAKAYAYAFNRNRVTEESLRRTFDNFLENNPSFKREDIFLQVDYSYGHYDEIDIDVSVNGMREETDEEYAARLEKEAAKAAKDKENAAKSKKKAKEDKEKKDLEEYLRLREKYKDKKID